MIIQSVSLQGNRNSNEDTEIICIKTPSHPGDKIIT